MLQKYPIECSVKGSQEYKKTLWTYKEKQAVIDEIFKQMSMELIPFLKDEKLVALAQDCVRDCCKKITVTEEVFLETQTKDIHVEPLEEIKLITTELSKEIHKTFESNLEKIDPLFRHKPYMYASYIEWFEAYSLICLSSVPETDFNANYTDLLVHFKKRI